MFQAARTQWDGREVIDIVTRHTRGQLEFADVDDLERLGVIKREIEGSVLLVEKSLGRAAQQAARAFRGDWPALGETIGVDWRHLRSMAEAVARTPGFVPHPDVRVALDGVPERNPLTEAWEIKQLRSLWSAAVQMVEDATCDLVIELDSADTQWSAMAYALWERDADTLRHRVAEQRASRGRVGDERRRVVQVF